MRPTSKSFTSFAVARQFSSREVELGQRASRERPDLPVCRVEVADAPCQRQQLGFVASDPVPGETRETLLQCTKRLVRTQCPGLVWVTKTPADELIAFCMTCKNDEMMVHNWQDTDWAEGMTEPVPTRPEVDPRLH